MYIYIYINYSKNSSSLFGSPITSIGFLCRRNLILFISWKKMSRIIMEPEESIKTTWSGGCQLLRMLRIAWSWFGSPTKSGSRQSLPASSAQEIWWHRTHGTKTMLKMENGNQGNGRNIKPPVPFVVSRDLTSNFASTKDELWYVHHNSHFLGTSVYSPVKCRE